MCCHYRVRYSTVKNHISLLILKFFPCMPSRPSAYFRYFYVFWLSNKKKTPIPGKLLLMMMTMKKTGRVYVYCLYFVFCRLYSCVPNLTLSDLQLTYEHGQTEQFGILHALRGKVQTCLRINLSNATLCID